MSQHQSMHLNRILDNVAPGTAMKYIFSCTFFFKTCTALQVELASMTEIQLADIYLQCPCRDRLLMAAVLAVRSSKLFDG